MGGHRSFKRTMSVVAVAGATTGLLVGTAGAATPGTGPSTTQSPYLTAVAPGAAFQSILSAGDSVPLAAGAAGVAAHPTTFKLAGIPDGMGAFDNGDGTYTVLVNQEIGAGLGIDRPGDAGQGAFVSRLVINKATSQVVSGEDQIKRLFLSPTGGAYVQGTSNLTRFCSADLPAVSAFYNAATGLGTQNRIFMNGEEGGTGRAFAHVASGPARGDSYELPRLGKQAWENGLANPSTGDLTVVMEDDDTTTTGSVGGQVFLYVGSKTSAGTDVDKAGLTNGSLSVMKVNGVAAESRTNGLSTTTPTFTGTVSFSSLGTGGDVSTLSQASLETQAFGAGTSFLRPEDGVWDPQNPNIYYFQTTDQYDQVKDGVGSQVGRTRLWKVTLTDRTNPTLGGSIEALLDGTEPIQMLDNITADGAGHLILLEDVGGNAHNGKVWQYDLATDALTQVARHDIARFGDIGVPATAPFTIDEETSGVIPAFDILGPDWYLIVVQAHYNSGNGVDAEVVEGGQLLAMYAPSGPPANVPEVPLGLLLPAGAALLCGAAVLVKRRQLPTT